MVELLVAFACLIVLLTIVASAMTTYLNAGTSVISSYQASDQLLPGSVIIQRLIRSEVEPAPTPASTATTNTCATALNVPCPPFVMGSTGTYSTTFYANTGDPNGPSKIVMTESTPTLTGKFYSSVFTVDQYPACPVLAAGHATATCPVNPGCPFSLNATSVCTWSSAFKVLVDIPNVVNGAATVSPQVTVNGVPTSTPLPDHSNPIFTYDTLDPYSLIYTPADGGTASATGMLFASPGTCTAPTPASNPTTANCDTDTIQSVDVDLEVEVQGSPIHENDFTVYRLSSASYLYSPVVG